ncbi:glycosyltransferase family 2 protein [Acinetobacter calcoaceticus]|uniref:glycosyltransferase family 2 protein n=1 Tax=Acinetobacter calcoaceticus TaxID=471 RepID=UPI001901FB6C|nr:glycosyltransferase family A protein [Acinetobacter calcoaceticus]MBJ9722871.1 glycosyltransferase family 2 protein [Acinetobacter calcoaceticus]
MKISVVIPMYNSSKTILRALNSVKNQSYKCEYEVLVVNDGSSDNSRSIVENYIPKSINNKFNIVLLDQNNGGVSKARNAGLRIATGDFIAFLDSDDEWFSNKIEKQINLIKQYPDIDFLGCAFDGLYLNKLPEDSLLKINLEQLIYKNYFQPSTVIMKKDVLIKIGFFDEDQKYAEEGNYFIRVANIFNCYFGNFKVLNYGDGKSGFGVSGLSANLKEMHKGFNKNLKFAYKNNLITLSQYILARTVEQLKYIRRVLIVGFKK